MDDKHNVSDPTDWQHTSTPLLSSVDASLRCQVCKDFFDAAVITNCAHTFCSKCIRRAISADGKCPACRTSTSEHQLRRNVVVQEVVQAFETARAQTLDVARRKQEEDSEIPQSRTRGSKRKRGDILNDGSSKAPRTRSQRKNAGEGRSADDAMVIDDNNGANDDDYTPDSQSGVEDVDDGLVPCPICNKRMKEDAVYSHLDTCDGSGKDKEPRKQRSRSPRLRATPAHVPVQSSAQPKPPPERLPQLNYFLLKEYDLRRKLLELGIPSMGSKDLLTRRHKEWVNICNSNCDSLRPRSKRELLKDLDSWERTQGGSVPFANAHTQQNAGVMAKDFDGAGWAKQNKGDFDALIANARKGREKALAQKSEDARDGEQTAPQAAAHESPPALPETPPDEARAHEPPDQTEDPGDRPPPLQTTESPSQPLAPPPPQTPHLALPSLSPEFARQAYNNTDRIPYRRSKGASPVPGFSYPASDTGAESPHAVLRRDSSSEAGVAVARTDTDAGDGGPVFKVPDLPGLHSVGSGGGELSVSEEMATAPAPAPAVDGLGARLKPMFELPGNPVTDAEIGSAR